MVESALVFPLILILLLGMVEVGRISNAYIVVMHAARHGARHGAVGGTNAEIETRVRNASVPLNPSELGIVIMPQQGRQSGQDITVSVSYPLKMITPLAGSIFQTPLTVRSEITMRVE